MKARYASLAAASIVMILITGIAVWATKYELANFTSPKDSGRPILYFLDINLKLTSVIVGLPAAMFAVLSYVRSIEQNRLSQLWQRKEFVEKNIQVFMAKPETKLVLQILDYDIRRVNLHQVKRATKDDLVRVDRRLLGAALMWHQIEGRSRYNRDLAAIRDLFDAFFDGLSQFDIMIEANLINDEDVLPYLKYWLDRLSGNHASALTRSEDSHGS